MIAPTVVRSLDADFVNKLANDPSIHPWVSVPGQGQVDLTSQVQDERNVVIKADGGAFFFHHVAPNVFEAHSLFLPSSRGSPVMQAAQDALAYIFHAGAEVVLARCPKGNLPVLALTRALKFEFVGTKEAAWPTSSGLVAERWFQMTRDHWASLQEK